jgi:(4S)-4-hydroxy-5-phosphonooxypentane-2,3-dione isomerase
MLAPRPVASRPQAQDAARIRQLFGRCGVQKQVAKMADEAASSCQGDVTQCTMEERMRAILAYLTTKPGKQAEFQEKMTAQAKRCLANEPGCLQFDVVQDPENTTRFVMIEVYRDDAAVKAHQDSQHYKDFRPVISDLVADRNIEILNMVSDGKSKR